MEYRTVFGSLDSYEKGYIEIVDDDPKHYAFSNIFEVAAHSKPYEKVAVGKNMQYVLEAIRAEGDSDWRTAAHDEFALVLDGTVEVHLVKLAEPAVAADKEGSVSLGAARPSGAAMGHVVGRRGHMVLLPANAAYQFKAAAPGVILLQTILGDDTIERWADICITQ